MKQAVALVVLGLVAALLVPVGLIGATAPSNASSSPSTPAPSVSTVPVVLLPSIVTAAASPLAPPVTSVPNANITVASASLARGLSWSFWGLNVAAEQTFHNSDAARIAATPVTFLRFPGGDVAEGYNYTSGLITNLDGSTQHAGATTADFVTACESIGCHAIMQLPAEIDQPYTAADYADYVVHTLHYQPAYWEIGNAVPGWTHFDQPWSQWNQPQTQHVSATSFAQEVGQYITAIKKVDHGAHFIAFGSAMGTPDYAKTWISEIALVDGKNLSGISVHSYVMGAAPANPTWSELLGNLTGKYSMSDQVAADRSYLSANCPGCNLKLFITEANGAEVNNFTELLPSFAGDLYLAADVTYGLNLRLTNIDWFCYSSNYGGAWENGGHWQMQYTLFTQMFSLLGHQTLGTHVTGPSTFFAAATYNPTSGLSLLMVNTNLTSKVEVNLGATGILLGSVVGLRQWVNGSSGPTNSSLTVKSTLKLPALSISILTVAPKDLGPAAPASAVSTASPHSAVPALAPTGAVHSHPSGGTETRDGPGLPAPAPVLTTFVPGRDATGRAPE